MIFVDRGCRFNALLVHLFLFFCFILWGAVLAFAGSHNVKKRFDPSTSEFSFDATSMISDSGARLDYQWSIVSKPTGSNAVLKQSVGPFSGLTADVSGTFSVELSVTEAGGTTKIIPFTVSTEQLEPEAVFEVRSQSGQWPGPQLGAPVILDAASSYHPGGALLQYSWSLLSAPDGSEASVTVSSPYQGSLIPDIAGTYQIELVTTDAFGNSSRAERAFTVGQTVSIANAGPDKSVVVGLTVLLDPFSSISPSGKALSAQWHILHRPEGSVAELGEAVKGRVPFSPDTAGHYVIQLSVSSEDEGSNDTVVIVAGAADQTNVAPQAAIAVQNKADVGGESVLDGSLSSDFDGDQLTYLWALVTAPQASNLSFSSASGPLADFSPDVAGDYIFSLTVDDGALSDTQTIVVSTANGAVSANAGIDLVLPGNRQVSVDGSASIFSEGTSNAYSWSVTGLGTPGATEASVLSNFQNVSTDIAFNAATGTGAVAGRNLIRNGRFETHNLSPQRGWGLFETVDGWTSPVGLIELQRHDYQTGNKVGNTIVELDSRSNSTIATTFKTDQAGTYNFSFDYAMRGTNPHSNGLLVKLDGTVIATISPNNFGFKLFEREVSLDPGEHLLEIQGGGRSDSYGTVIDNVFLGLKTSHTLGDELIINGAFEEHNLSSRQGWGIFETIKGWTSPVGRIEIQTRNYGTGNRIGNSIVELDAYFNSTVEQNVTVLEDGLYELSFDHAMRGSNVASNGVAVLVDGVVVRQIMPDQPGFHGSKISLELKQGTHKLAFAALGKSDRYGTVIDNVSLRGKINGTTRAIDTAVVQLKVSDDNNAVGTMSFDTLLVTNGAIAPVARITPSATHADIGTAIQLNGAGSSDANGDTLNYRWALLSKPARSSATLTGNGPTVSIEPDHRGAYIVQLIVSDGGLESAPVTITIFGNNQSPTITSEPVLEGIVGNLYAYTATGVDPDEDTLQWSLVSAPDGMTINTQTGEVSWTPTEAGSYNVVIAVNDSNGGVAEQNYTVTTEFGGNTRPPTIDSIANLTLRPGETAQFTVQGSDPEGEGLTYYVNPLPTGASFDPATGVFSITASDEIGTTSVIASVTDGVFSASAPFTITIEPWPDTQSTRFSGRVLDAQDFANGIQTPVIGATINIAGKSSTTDNNGEFNFTELGAAGTVGVHVDGSTASAASDGKDYGGYQSALTIHENAPNVIQTAFLLARIDGEITEVVDRLPPYIRSCKIRRVNVSGTETVGLSTLGLSVETTTVPGTIASIWATSPTYPSYQRVGTGQVSSDGVTLENITGNVTGGSNVIVTPLPAKILDSALQPKEVLRQTLLGEGNLQAGFSLPSYDSLGVSRAPSFIYNSTTADPRPIITANVRIAKEMALPGTLRTELYVNGQQVPGHTVTNLAVAENPENSVPQEDADAVVSLSVSFNASAFTTGTYDYEMLVFADNACAAAAVTTGKVMINNRIASPYGKGWKPTEVQTLQVNVDGSVAIEEPDGSLSQFNKSKVTENFNKKSLRYETAGGLYHATGDFNNDGFLDFATGESNSGNIRIFLNDKGTDFTEIAPIKNAFEIVEAPLQGEYRPTLAQLKSDDMNQDGITDLIMAVQTGEEQGISIMYGTGQGQFKNPVNVYDARTVDVAVADLNNDLLPDFVTVQLGFFGKDKFTLLNNGDGSFTQFRLIRTFHFDSTRFVTVDLDKDGYVDAVSNGLTEHRNNGAGELRESSGSQAPHLELLQQSHDVAQGRSSPDYFGVSIGADVLTVARFNLVRYNFDTTQQYTLSELGVGAGSSVRFVDMNGNGNPDIVFQTSLGSNGLYVIYADQNGNYGEPQSLNLLHSLGSTEVADFDNDGVQDLFSVNRFEIFVDFGNGGEGDFQSPFGDFSDLVELPDGGYQRTYKDGTVVSFNAKGQQTSVADSNGNTTSYVYNADGAVESVTDPTGETTSFTYANGKVASTTTPDGRVTRMEYDAAGNLIDFTHPDDADIAYGYDEFGRMTSQTDKNGNQTTYGFGAGGRLTKETAPDGASNSISIARSLGLSELGAPEEGLYVPVEDRVSVTTDSRGNQSTVEVNEFGAMLSSTDALNRTTRYFRSQNNLVERIESPSSVTESGIVVSIVEYDDNGNPTTKIDAFETDFEKKVTYEYEPELSRMTKSTDAAGYSVTYTHDEEGNVLTNTDQDGGVTTYTYNEFGQVLTQTDRRGNTLTQTYNSRGLADTLTDAAGFKTRNVYNNRGHLILQIQGEGTPEEKRVSYGYDALNRVTSMLNGEAERSRYVYDIQGNLLKSIDPTGIETTHTYDKRNRRTSTTDPAAGKTTFEYDDDDNLVKTTAADGGVSTFTIDSVNRVSEVKDALGTTRRSAFDLRDNIIAITDGRGNTTTFAHDVLDHVIERTNPLGNKWQFTYDRLQTRDLLRHVVKPDGKEFRLLYNNRRLLTAIDSDLRFQRQFGYDAEDNILRATDELGLRREVNIFTYDERNLLITGQGSLNSGHFFSLNDNQYTYDAHGRRTSSTEDDSGAQQLYTWDKADRLTSVTAPSGKIFSFAYDPAGRRTQLSYPNGLTTNASFLTPLSDQTQGTTGQLKSLTFGLDINGDGGSSLNGLLGSFTYGYDVKSNITNINESGTAGRQRAYQLDIIDRLTKVTDGTDATQGTPVETYTLDEEGNRTNSHLSSLQLANANNQLTEDDDHLFEYDVNGNLVRKTVKSTSETWRYGYNIFDELILATRHGDAEVDSPVLFKKEYSYDGLGRRAVEVTNDGLPTAIFYDGMSPHRFVTWTQKDAMTSKDVFWYTYSDRIDELLSITPATEQTSIYHQGVKPQQVGYHVHADHQSSVRAVTDDAGAVINEYSYDSYGNAETTVEGLPQPFRYTGREWDNDIALYHYRARVFDPVTGRFLQEDPLFFGAGDHNLYRYVWNNPTNWTDPSGMAAAGEYGGVAGVTARVLGGGAKATRAMLSTGKRTAAFIARSAKNGANVLSSISARISCNLFIISDALAAAGDAANAGAHLVNMAVSAAECGVKFKLRKPKFKRIKTCPYARKPRGRSFEAGTLVFTRRGMVAIEKVQVGEEVASIDEVTGIRVWRKVTERYSRMASSVLEIVAVGSNGTRQTMRVTAEHPIHLEEWNAKPRGSVLAALENEAAIVNGGGAGVTNAVSDGGAKISPATLFPSDQKTAYGDWVKAGAIKKGDRLSTFGSVYALKNNGPTMEAAQKLTAGNDSQQVGAAPIEGQIKESELTTLGLLKAANDNTPLTVEKVTTNPTPTRVYNLEITSQSGQITHNYMVGEEMVWGHNRKQVFLKFPSRKGAKDARPRRKPTPPGLSGSQMKKRKRCGLGNEPDKHANNKDDPQHFHDDNHHDPSKPNIHYGFD